MTSQRTLWATPAGGAGQGEQRQPGHEDGPAATRVAEAPGGHQRQPERDRVPAEDPLQAVAERAPRPERMEGSATLTMLTSSRVMNAGDEADRERLPATRRRGVAGRVGHRSTLPTGAGAASGLAGTRPRTRPAPPRAWRASTRSRTGPAVRPVPARRGSPLPVRAGVVDPVAVECAVHCASTLARAAAGPHPAHRPPNQRVDRRRPRRGLGQRRRDRPEKPAERCPCADGDCELQVVGADLPSRGSSGARSARPAPRRRRRSRPRSRRSVSPAPAAHAVPLGPLDHDVGERPERRPQPASDDDPGSLRRADAGDLAVEAHPIRGGQSSLSRSASAVSIPRWIVG